MTRRRDRSRDIVDAAEALFATGSFEGVSIRHIAKAAHVPLGLVTYYFSTKEALIDRVIARRAAPLNEAREAALSAADLTDVQSISRAFVEPLLEFVEDGEPGWHSYSLLISKANQSSSSIGIMARYFNATADKFIKAYADALPGVPYEVCARGFMMEGTLMLGLLSYRRLDTLSHGVVRSDDVRTAYRYLMCFSGGGWDALKRDFSTQD